MHSMMMHLSLVRYTPISLPYTRGADRQPCARERTRSRGKLPLLTAGVGASNHDLRADLDDAIWRNLEIRRGILGATG
jgi:hypothetical protein